MAAAGVAIVVLVILGAIIIDRNGSGDAEPAEETTTAEGDLTDEEAAARDEGREAGAGPQGSAPDIEQWDLCELLAESTAENLVSMDLYHQGNLDTNISCRYRSEDSPAAVFVTLNGTGRTVYHCSTETEAESGQYEPCPVTGEPVPSLPEGRVSWHEKPPESFSDTSPSGIWVQWDAAGRPWGLWYSDQRWGDEAADVLQRKDALIAEAEEIHSAILAGVGRP